MLKLRRYAAWLAVESNSIATGYPSSKYGHQHLCLPFKIKGLSMGRGTIVFVLRVLLNSTEGHISALATCSLAVEFTLQSRLPDF